MDLEARCTGGAGTWEALSRDEKTSWLAWWKIDRQSRGLFPYEVTSA